MSAGQFLRHFEGAGVVGFHHWCPGCGCAHSFYVENSRGRPCWTFDGNLEKPTFSPSMRLFTPKHTDEDGEHPEETLCHYFLRAGQIEYLGDCKHELKGQTVPLPPFPADYNTGEKT